ncbi:MAG: hypothetical protein ACKOYN_09695 [Planctomycetota bacterium]
MGLTLRAAAFAAGCAFAASGVANAAFVYSSSSRSVDVTVNSTVVDSEFTSAFGGWFGSASSNGAGYSALAQQGSNLASLEMSLVGSATVDASATAAIMARSMADISFIASASESISWLASLGSGSTGSAAPGLLTVRVTDSTSGTVVLAFTGPTAGSGSFGVVAGRSYRVEVSAMAIVQGGGLSAANYSAVFSAPVPAPGAIALLGLAGLVGRRRR